MSLYVSLINGVGSEAVADVLPCLSPQEAAQRNEDLRL